MKRYPLFLPTVLILALLFNSPAAAGPNDEKSSQFGRDKIKMSAVKSITEFEYTNDSHDWKQRGIKTAQLKYDRDANLLEQFSFNNDGDISLHTIYKYSAIGKVSRRIDFLGDGNIESSADFKYDTDGKLIDEAWFYGDRLDKRLIRKYDRDKNLVKWTSFLGGEDVDFKHTYKYDENKKLVLETSYTKNIGESKSAHKYNRNGAIIETRAYGDDGELTSLNSFQYDSNENKISETLHDLSENAKIKNLYKYDGRGNRVEKKEYIDSQPSMTLAYKYDLKNNLVEETNINGAGKLEFKIYNRYDDASNKIEEVKYNSESGVDYKFTYKYDARNNLVEKVKYRYQSMTEPETMTKYVYEFYFVGQ